jgi:hypothetical protein
MRTWKLSLLASAVTVVAACGDVSTPSAPRNVSPRTLPRATIVAQIPAEDPGPPYYAVSGNGGFIPHTDAWAAIPFERSLNCVPSGANLLQVSFAAFGCALTVSGHAHWENGPTVDLAPRQTDLSGNSVPMVFAAWSEIQAAKADGVLTLPELLALPSAIVGTADQYTETDIFGISGPLGAGRGMYKITARGSLMDGRSFRLHVNEVLGELQVVEIKFEQ